jgi:hypothetical protein
MLAATTLLSLVEALKYYWHWVSLLQLLQVASYESDQLVDHGKVRLRTAQEMLKVKLMPVFVIPGPRQSIWVLCL